MKPKISNSFFLGSKHQIRKYKLTNYMIGQTYDIQNEGLSLNGTF